MELVAKEVEGADADQVTVALTALRRGDPTGLEVVARRYQVLSLRLAFGVLGDRQAAEDVVADALVLAFERIKQFDESRPFAPWFYRIVINTAKKVRRRRGAESRAHERQRTTAEPGDDTAAEVIAADERREVFSAVQALPNDERVAVILRYYLDASMREIAEILGWPEGTVKRRLYNARKALRSRLTRRLDLAIDDKEGTQCFTPTAETQS